MVKLAHGVLAVAHTTNRTREGLTVDLIDGQCGSDLQSVLQRSAVYIIRIREGGILAYADNLINLIRAVEAGGKVLEVGMLQHTSSLLIVEREERRALVGGLRERDVVVLGDTSTTDFIHPVGIAVRHGLLGIHIAIVVTAYGVRLSSGCCRVVNGNRRTTGNIECQTIVVSIVIRILTVVESSLNQGCGILLTIEELHLVGHPCYRQRSVEVDIDLITLLTFLGGDDDHTVGSTRSVDRCRSGILQYLHGLDVGGVEAIERTAIRHTVDDVKRSCA